MEAPLDMAVIASMSDEQLASEVIALIDQALTDGINELGPSSYLVEDIGIDSLGSYELIMDVEDRFGIKIDPTQALNFKTIDDIVTWVRWNSRSC